MTSKAGREVRHDHELERADDPVAGQGPAGQEGGPVPEPGDRERPACHAPVERPRRKYNEGSKAIYQGDQPILNGASAISVLPASSPSSSALLK